MDSQLPTDLSTMVTRAQSGDALAAQQLFAALYEQLRRQARRELAKWGPQSALGATTLLHEAYLDISQRDALAFPTQAHFLAYAARAMRGLLIDRVRELQAQKRGEALDELAQLEPALAQVVDLKFFCGFSMAEIATMQNSSERTVQRQWEKARLMLYHAMRGS